MDAGSIVAHVKAKIDEFKAGISQAKEELNGLKNSAYENGKKMAETGKTLTKYVTAPIMAVGTMAVKTAADFEQGMNKVRAITGATGETFDRLKNIAMEMGRTTKYTATESADALSYLGMAGFSAEESIAALPGVLQLAAAGNMDLATTADYASNILTGYGLEVSELARVNDVLAKTFTSSNTNMEQLAEAMKYVGPIASGFGIQLEETAAALGMLGDAGIQGSMAGTTLRQALIQLMTPGGRAAETIERLGLVTQDAQGEFVGFVSIVEQLEESGASTADMMDLFGARGAGMIALVSRGSDEFKEFIVDLENAGGTAQYIAEVQMEGLTGSWLKMRSALESLMIVVGNQLLPIATAIINKLTEWFSALAQLDEGTLQTIIVIAGLVAAIGPLLLIVGKVRMMMAQWQLTNLVLQGGLAGLGSTAATTGAAASTMGTKIGAMGTKIAGAVGPVLAFAAAIAAAYLYIRHLGSEWEKGMVGFEEAFNEFWGNTISNFIMNQQTMLDAQTEAQQQAIILELEFLAEKENLSKEELARVEELGDQLAALQQEADNKRLLIAELSRIELHDVIMSAEGEITEDVVAAIQERRQLLLTELETETSEQIAAVVDKYSQMETIDMEAFAAEIAAIKAHAGDRKAEIDNMIADEVAAAQAGYDEIKGVYNKHTGEMLEGYAAHGATLKEFTEQTGFEVGELWHQAGWNWTERTKDGLFKGRDQIRAEMGMAIDGALEEGNRKQPLFENLGKSLIDGLRNGILGGAIRLAQALVGVVQNAIANAKKALQSSSPSKVAMRLGYTVPEGLALGITDAAKLVKDAMESVASEAININMPELALPGMGSMAAATPINITNYYTVPDKATAEHVNNDMLGKIQAKLQLRGGRRSLV